MAEISDFRPLARYLDSHLSPDDCVDLSDLAGFLTCIVAGPEQTSLWAEGPTALRAMPMTEATELFLVGDR